MNSDEIRIRFDLARERIRGLYGDSTSCGKFEGLVHTQAGFIIDVLSVFDEIKDGTYTQLPLAELEKRNEMLFSDIAGENYKKSFCDPDFSCKEFGVPAGKIIAALSSELRTLIHYVFEDRLWDIVITMELFLQFVSAFESFDDPKPEYLQDILYSHFYDYCPELTQRRVRELVDPGLSFVRDIVMTSDLSDPSYMYMYGEYVSASELKTAEFLNSLDESEIEGIAGTFAEGYRQGFIAARKDITKKKTVNIRFLMGFERIVRAAVRIFEEMGLQSVIYRASGSLMYRRYDKTGFFGGAPSCQYDYDHIHDGCLILDEKMTSRRLTCLHDAFEEYKKAANVHGGPAVIDTFGEELFVPEDKESAVKPDDEKRALKASYEAKAAQITNRYIIGSERSFTIIAFPTAGIGADYPEIFREITKINMLDAGKYGRIQKLMIDELDQAERVLIRGKGGNMTDLSVSLAKLDDPGSQTNFENCTADVNIPVGEVFTTPVLKGTQGTLHVSGVYLNGLQFNDLKIIIKDGMIDGYSCEGQEGDPEGKKYIEDNILFGHKTLPIGEFAIGTNTEACRLALKYGIGEKLPILIAEKTGPHFAFGDTCYSFEEDLHIFNPDGKEIMAKDNECSAKRRTDPESAYFNCHTDITIPYDELDYIRAVKPDGTMISIIENGKYAVKGTEELNIPLEDA